MGDEAQENGEGNTSTEGDEDHQAFQKAHIIGSHAAWVAGVADGDDEGHHAGQEEGCAGGGAGDDGEEGPEAIEQASHVFLNSRVCQD